MYLPCYYMILEVRNEWKWTPFIRVYPYVNKGRLFKIAILTKCLNEWPEVGVTSMKLSCHPFLHFHGTWAIAFIYVRSINERSTFIFKRNTNGLTSVHLALLLDTIAVELFWFLSRIRVQRWLHSWTICFSLSLLEIALVPFQVQFTKPMNDVQEQFANWTIALRFTRIFYKWWGWWGLVSRYWGREVNRLFACLSSHIKLNIVPCKFSSQLSYSFQVQVPKNRSHS